MYLLIVFLPLLGSVVSGFTGRKLGRTGAAYITIGCISLTTLFAYKAFYNVAALRQVVYLELAPWIHSGLLHINWGFLFDSLTVTMLVTVMTVSLVVHIYSVGYMSEDPHVPRFMSYLSLFTFFMLILVTADNFIQLFVGWEGVGLCSYLLIGFWHTRIEANQAAMKAMIVNRIGDFGFVMAVCTMYYTFKSVNFANVFAMLPKMQDTQIWFVGTSVDAVTIIGLFFLMAAMGKSAQIGLHTWLPDAMEGPTPVSALIHAATMVTAGVFMIIRTSPIYEYTPTALFMVTVVGALTAFFAATAGLVQNDLKKVIAYSTCSQLGYMVFACGISSYSVSIFHLMNHAFFKALLFLGAGCVIHSVADEQDMRKMGGLIQILPFTYAMMLIGSLSLMGFPFLTGFYSKDVILELAYAKFTISSQFAYWLGVTAAFFTAFYSFRLLFLTFTSTPKGSKVTLEQAHDAPPMMGVPLLLLAFGSIFVGYFGKDMMVGLGTDFWGSAILTLPNSVTMVDSEFIPTSIKLIPVIFSISGALGAFIVYSLAFSDKAIYKAIYSFSRSWPGRKLYTFLAKKWYFDNIYNHYVAAKAMTYGYVVSFKTLDRGFIELIGPHGLSRYFAFASKKLSRFQTGFVYNYTFIMIVGVITIMTFVYLRNVILFNYQLYFIFLVMLAISSGATVKKRKPKGKKKHEFKLNRYRIPD